MIALTIIVASCMALLIGGVAALVYLALTACEQLEKLNRQLIAFSHQFGHHSERHIHALKGVVPSRPQPRI